MDGGPTDYEEDDSTATIAEEIAKETAALNSLLRAYASKADVERSLRAERASTERLVGERDRARLVTVIVCVVAVMFSIGMSVWALGVSHDAKHSAKTANAALAGAQRIDERQQQVSCADSNKNRAALVSVFDFIDKLETERAAVTGTPADKPTEDLITFGRLTFAPRDCDAEAAALQAQATTTTGPGG